MKTLIFTLLFFVSTSFAATPVDKEDFSKYKVQEIQQTKAHWLTVVRFAKPDEKHKGLFSNLLILTVDARDKDNMHVASIIHAKRTGVNSGKILTCAYDAGYIEEPKKDTWHIIDTDDVEVCNAAIDSFIGFLEKQIEV